MRVAFRGVIAAAAVAVLGAGIVHAATYGGEKVRVAFNGWLSPQALPRAGQAPVALHLKGGVSTPHGDEPPQLRRMTIELNRHGKLSTVGLPTCPERRISNATTKGALAACRSALVGGGGFSAHIAIPTQPPFPARGKLLAFNSVRNGQRVVLAHIFGTVPVPTTQVLELVVRRVRHGTYGTNLSVKMPDLAEHWGYVTGFQLTLHRTYTYKGRLRSFISAGCPAPAGFNSALFPAARGTYYLSDGRKRSRVLDASCKVSD